MLNYGGPFVGPNSSVYVGHFGIQTPLLLLARYFECPTSFTFETTEKIILLLERGADVKVTDNDGRTCLHMILNYGDYRHMLGKAYCIHKWQQYCKKRKADAGKILVALVKAGADVYARNNSRKTVSEIAHCRGRTKLWMKFLKTCGYNPWNVLAKGGLNIGCRTCFPLLDTDEDNESCWDTSSDMNTDEDETSTEDETGDELNMDEEILESETEDELDTNRDEESIESETDGEVEMEYDGDSSAVESDIDMDDDGEAESDDKM